MTAARRWLGLLATSTLTQSWAVLRSDSEFADLTQTQYAEALDWLIALDLLERSDSGLKLADSASSWPQDMLAELVFSRTISAVSPMWLRDADILIEDASDLPQDAGALADAFGLDGDRALGLIRQVHGKIDLAERARVGELGEAALVAFLEAHWPGSTRHVSLLDDGFGYDVAFVERGVEWHIEVKSTMRRGRLTIFLSRHEYEVASRDPNWRLVVVGVQKDGEAGAIATVDHHALRARAPADRDIDSRWQSARYEIHSDELTGGLPFICDFDTPACSGRIAALVNDRSQRFAWMPNAVTR